MRGDVMVWIGRLVAAVFVLGLVALAGGVWVMVQRAEGVPPLPILGGLAGAVVLILMAGACLALISVAVSARRGAEALQRLAAQQPAGARVTALRAEAPEAPVQGPFREEGLRETALREAPRPENARPEAAPVQAPRPARPGRVLVAER